MIWLLEYLDPKSGWLIEARCNTEDEAHWRQHHTPSCYQRRVRGVMVNVPAARHPFAWAGLANVDRTVVSEEFRRACGRIGR